jgi:hypothetical protein
MSILWVVVVIFSSVVVLTPNEQFLGCVSVAFSERHVSKNASCMPHESKAYNMVVGVIFIGSCNVSYECYKFTYKQKDHSAHTGDFVKVRSSSSYMLLDMRVIEA